jgi:hypothetical protein
VRRLSFGLVFLLATAAASFGQTAPLPEPIDLFQYSKAPSRAYGFPSFRIWGWSRDGKIAYSMEREVEGRGGVQIEFLVVDLVSDELLWDYPDDSNTWESYDEASDGSYMEYAHKLAADSLQEALDGYQIILAPSDFLKLPITSSGRSYDVSIKTEKEKKASIGDAIASYSVLISRDDKKAKVVTKSSEVKALAVYVCGYFASPYESRVAIVTAEERFVFEGTEIFY